MSKKWYKSSIVWSDNETASAFKNVLDNQKSRMYSGRRMSILINKTRAKRIFSKQNK